MPLTCVTCRVVFVDSETHRSHFKSEWHKYNLKRKIAELPTVSFDEYKAREAKYRQATAPNLEETLICKPCHKHFNSENALQSHLKSKKHIEICNKQAGSTDELVKNIKNKSVGEVERRVLTEQLDRRNGEQPDEIVAEDDDDDWESVDEDEDIPVVPTNICMFCNYKNSGTEENIQHMKVFHSFYIPDLEYMRDPEGLLCYLGQKVLYGFTCLSCNNQKRSVHAVQQHMIAKGHCRMKFEGSALEEYEDFYDYTASYPDHSENPDEEAFENVLQPNDYELTLPSGATVGHRSLATYFRQNLKPMKDGVSKTAKFKHRYHALCHGGNMGTIALYKSKEYKYAHQRHMRYSLRLCIKQNRFQPHFRSQIMF